MSELDPRGAPPLPRRGLSILDRLLGRLSRVTSSGAYVAEVDGLRFIAIATVLVHHVGGTLAAYSPGAPRGVIATLVEHGYIGVPVFFAISGFILALPFAERHLGGRPGPSLKLYFLRRLTRLEPPYIVCLLICLLRLAALRLHAPAVLARHFSASVVYLHEAFYGQGSLLNPVAWSLEIEVQFYVLAPLLCSVFLIKRKGLRRLAMALGLMGAYALRHGLHHWLRIPAAFDGNGRGQLVLDYLAYFAVGILAADLYLNEWQTRPTRARALAHDAAAVLALIGLYGVLAIGGRFGTFSMVMSPPLIFVIVSGAFRGARFKAAIRIRVLTTIGGMCYSIYLYHMLVLALLGKRLRLLAVSERYSMNFLVGLLVVIPAILAFCAVAFVLFEKPFMRKDWHARWWTGACAWKRSTSSVAHPHQPQERQHELVSPSDYGS